MKSRYASQIQHLIDAVLETPGETVPILRHAVEEQAAQLSCAISQEQGKIPLELEKYITKLVRHAYTVTDQDVAELQRAGYGEDAIFEITLSAALGTSMVRLERGLTALKGETNAPQED